ncbi:MAG: nucleoside triphosphate pyrophosphohydrolase [Desulfarculus sp.]|nr:nucleoside triphosphate pyrophosphohydrolase [Pseudomonadota bacterium]MBV1715510.1 nucleoside triphosphate pyrophosphohydrolase [Desulfarculus sp.]MBU4574326.1 nucleoside triphosphate pyrophosphohydrolase [Pseudomonadota bacterium]MBU4596435.1 nucleoside triphosphate pyrophosphohydrolase [Pseudomonadota bacterium]MBV1740319.1 nucleoside triphosphate pyrophosphohydrolase [Desulfarculus sp.]
MTDKPGGDGLGHALEALAELAARLRAPDGCPWDREQTPVSAAAYLLEEAYEATEAIESGSTEEVRGELGDLLFQVVFQAQLFAEAGGFDLTEVIEEVRAKMVRRHPHVFGEAEAKDAGEVKQRWSEIKRQERRDHPQGLLDSVPLGAPALLRAQRLGSRAAKVGFDWDDAAGVWAKIGEETAELAAAGPESEQAELGDVLFSWAQWARHRGLGAEAALREANRRFTRRFEAMEAMAARLGVALEDMSPDKREELWAAAKAQEAPLSEK